MGPDEIYSAFEKAIGCGFSPLRYQLYTIRSRYSERSVFVALHPCGTVIVEFLASASEFRYGVVVDAVWYALESGMAQCGFFLPWPNGRRITATGMLGVRVTD